MPAFARSYSAIAIEAAGVPIGRDLVDREAAATLARVRSPADTVSVRRIHNRWLLAVLALARGELAAARGWRDSLLLLRVRDSLAAERELFLTSLDARLQLAAGDTAAALSLLERLAPGVKQVQLRWNPWYAFSHERMLRARIYLRGGQALRAFEVAAGFDSPASFGLLPWLAASLELRRGVAEQLGGVENSDSLAARVAHLQRGDHR
jgi:hypothetical protein